MDELLYTNSNSLSTELCNDIIQLFKCSDNKYKGCTFAGVNTDIKDTTDLVITSKSPNWIRIYNTLSNELNINIKSYINKFNKPMNINDKYNSFNSDLYFNNIQIQEYIKGQGKYIYHNDCDCIWNEHKTRRLTFIWYLNDIYDGGETEFLGKFLIKPETGKLLIFPACWTFPHKGNIPLSSNKYIITGWVYQTGSL